jgi:hypothetical protein
MRQAADGRRRTPVSFCACAGDTTFCSAQECRLQEGITVTCGACKACSQCRFNRDAIDREVFASIAVLAAPPACWMMFACLLGFSRVTADSGSQQCPSWCGRAPLETNHLKGIFISTPGAAQPDLISGQGGGCVVLWRFEGTLYQRYYTGPCESRNVWAQIRLQQSQMRLRTKRLRL